MATPKKTTTPTRTRRGRKKAAAVRSRGASGTGAITVPGPRALWTYMASPSVLMTMNGESVPDLAKAWHTPGLGGNGKGFDGVGAMANLSAVGFIEVPHDIECVAFGEKRDSDLSNYIDRYEVNGVVYHSDAWHRPRTIGHITRWEFDAAGWFAFLQQVRDEVLGGADDDMSEIAIQRALEAIDQLRDRTDSRSQREVKILISNLPVDRVPADLRAEGAE